MCILFRLNKCNYISTVLPGRFRSDDAANNKVPVLFVTLRFTPQFLVLA